MVDTSIEKKLKHDIHQKNMIRREIERRIRTVCQWKDKLANFKSFQKQKKYSASIKRYISEIEHLRVRLNQMNEDVDKRIREMGKYSDSEIKEFHSQLEQEIRDIEADKTSEDEKVSKGKDIAEIKNARKRLAELKGKGKLQGKIEKAKKKVNEDIEEVERITEKIMKLNRRLRKVSEGVKLDEEKLTLEDKDKFLFAQELKRIAREKVIYG